MADVTMPMNGKVIAVKAEVGQTVAEDDELVIIEAIGYETGAAETVDPLAGSYSAVQALTDQIERQAVDYIRRIDEWEEP